MTFIEKFNLIAALIGCLTGISGLILSLYLALLEFPSLKAIIIDKQIFTLNPNFSEYSDEIGNHIDEYSKDNCLIGMHIIITNLSKNPTSIHEIALNDIYLFNSSSNLILKSFPISFYLEDNHLFCKKSVSYNVASAKPIIRLESNETIDCCLTFANIPLELQNTKKLKLTIKSSQYTKNINFKPNFIKYTIET